MASRGMWLVSLLVIVLHGACENQTLGEQLCDAVEDENYTKAVQLLDSGADTEQQCEYYKTALISAAAKGSVSISEVLLEHGADPEARDTDGWTALHVAAIFGKVRISEALLEHGADPEARTNRGRTVLHCAAVYGHLAMVKLLGVNNSADPLARDNEMETPLELATNHWKEDVAAWLRTNGGAEPSPTSLKSWVHVLRFHPWEVAACAGVGVLLAGFKTTLEWMHSRGVNVATLDPSPALVGELVPSTGALRLAAKAITKDHRCGSLLEPMKLLANSFAVIASLLFVCGPCMWVVKPVYVAMVAGPAFLVPALWVFGRQEVVNFPVLVIAAKTPAGRCRTAVTSLILAVVVNWIWHVGFFCDLNQDCDTDFGYIRNGKLTSCISGGGMCGLSGHDASLSFSVGGFAWRVPADGLKMQEVHYLFSLVLVLATLLWVLGVAVTTPRCCRLPVASRAAVEQLACEIDGAGAAGELPHLHPKLQPEGLSGIVSKTGFAVLDILLDLYTVGTFVVTGNFWFAGILWSVFLASLGSELAKGNIQALPKELKRTLATGVMTKRFIEFLDTDKGFEAPFSLAITIYAMPFVAHNGNTFLVQCFSLLTSTLGIAGFLSNYLTQATLAEQSDADESTTTSSEGSDSADSASYEESESSEEQGP